MAQERQHFVTPSVGAHGTRRANQCDAWRAEYTWDSTIQQLSASQQEHAIQIHSHQFRSGTDKAEAPFASLRHQ